MTDDSYEILVRRLEGDSLHSPASFRVKVLLVSGLAYLILLLFLLALGAIIYFVVQEVRHSHRSGSLIRLALVVVPMIPLFWVTLSTFLTRLKPPQGRPLTPQEAPKLFATLEKLRKRLNGPPIHDVIVNEYYNAAIAQTPRFGLFGSHRNTLVVGLPYLLGSPPKEMLATLAHEYGHLAGNHGKVGAWVYRQRLTFGAIHRKVAADADSSLVNGIAAWALNAFAPYFNAYTFVLSRQQEYEADESATLIAGKEANGSGLIRDELLARWLHEDFWPKLYAQSTEREMPSFMPYATMRKIASATFDDWATRERLHTVLQQESGLDDTHPCLRDRLTAIDVSPTVPLPAAACAADVFLGHTTKQLIKEFDERWWRENRSQWQTRYRQVVDNARRRMELNAKPMEALGPFDLQEMANLYADSGDHDKALAALDLILRRPDGPFPRAHYLKGRLLLAQGRREGLVHLASAMTGDQRLIEDCLRVGYLYLRDTEGEEAANAWADHAATDIEAA